MNLSNYYIGGRQLFGFIAPGLVWIASGWLTILGKNPIETIIQISFTEAALLIAVSLIVGTSIETISFKIGVRLSAYFHKASLSTEDMDYLPSDIDKELIKRVRDLLKSKFGKDEFLGSLDNRRLTQFCKNFILERSAYFRKRVMEYEAEINLLAMMILPLFILMISWGVYLLFHVKGISLTEYITPSVLVGFICIVLISLMLYRLHPLRREEAEYWLEIFLALHYFNEEGISSGVYND